MANLKLHKIEINYHFDDKLEQSVVIGSSVSDSHIVFIACSQLCSEFLSLFPFRIHQVSLFNDIVFANRWFFDHSDFHLSLFFLLLPYFFLYLQLLLILFLFVFVQLIIFDLPQKKHKFPQSLLKILWVIVMHSVLNFERTSHSKALAYLQLNTHSYSIFLFLDKTACLQTAYKMTCKCLERRCQLQLRFEVYKKIDVQLPRPNSFFTIRDVNETGHVCFFFNNQNIVFRGLFVFLVDVADDRDKFFRGDALI